ncbi:hypothetical protein [Roseibium polysiphoniae]|uniref:hypothetical protein n=1 Tax=Roseibium polysiphoniae TaxID=2571221 RepID=UPI0032980D2E
MYKGIETVVKRRTGLVLAGALCAGLLAGCMSSSDEVTSGGASVSSKSKSWLTGITTSGKGPIEVNPDAFVADVYCPPIQLQTGTHLIMKFARRKEETPENLLYQATVEEWARECAREGTDQTRIKIGLSGDVTPGPAWSGGEVLLPVRVAVIPSGSDAKPLYSEIVSVPVTVGAGAPSEAWTLIESKFTVPRNQEMKIVVGFDEGKRR